MSLFDRLGQEAGIRTAVDDFYVRVVADPQLAP
jgi:hemoglobin